MAMDKMEIKCFANQMKNLIDRCVSSMVKDTEEDCKQQMQTLQEQETETLAFYQPQNRPDNLQELAAFAAKLKEGVSHRSSTPSVQADTHSLHYLQQSMFRTIKNYVEEEKDDEDDEDDHDHNDDTTI